jgi:hypothetical protein
VEATFGKDASTDEAALWRKRPPASRRLAAFRRRGLFGLTMTARDDAREERLAQALRENLRRRKAQARDRDASAGDAAEEWVRPSAGEPEAPPRSRS